MTRIMARAGLAVAAVLLVLVVWGPCALLPTVQQSKWDYGAFWLRGLEDKAGTRFHELGFRTSGSAKLEFRWNNGGWRQMSSLDANWLRTNEFQCIRETEAVALWRFGHTGDLVVNVWLPKIEGRDTVISEFSTESAATFEFQIKGTSFRVPIQATTIRAMLGDPLEAQTRVLD